KIMGLQLKGFFRRTALVLFTFFIVWSLSVTGNAAEDTKIVGTSVNDESFKIYVKGAQGGGEATYQIGNRATGQAEAVPLTEDDAPVRTLIMVDNSNSVAQQSDAAVGLVQNIINGHLEGELIRIATFGDSINYLTGYSDDYLALYNAVSAITFQSQSTYLTDILLPVLKELTSDGYEGLTRIVIISDGVDEENLNSTRAELVDVLQQRSFPIYTVGVRNGTATSDADLSAMFSLSRLTNASSAMLEENGGSALLQEMGTDAGIQVYRAQIPEEAKDGSTPNVRLTLADGTALTTQIDMPFSSIPDPVVSTGDTTDSSGGVSSSTGAVTTMSQGQTGSSTGSSASKGGGSLFSTVPLWVWFLIGGGVLLLLILLIVALVGSSKKKKKRTAAEQAPPVQIYEQVADNDQTEVIGETVAEYGGNTEMLFTSNTIQVTLEDMDRPASTFTEAVSGQIIVGRSPEKAQIAIVYEKSVSRTQCRLFDQNGQLFVENISDKNITKLNDRPVYTATQLQSGDVLTMGRVRMRVTIHR
ncbi:MAG: FHA domain-containing protein, partial [Lachnospiraceae bacterium]|nr:FHA domain-containing protein [Lachnospiraceae bacterium]